LQTIQRVWTTGRKPAEILLRLLLLRNVHAIMTHILTPVADILVVQELTDNFVAAPCFNYFPSRDNGMPEASLEPRALHGKLLEQVSSARDASPTVEVKKLLEEMRGYIEKKIPPE